MACIGSRWATLRASATACSVGKSERAISSSSPFCLFRAVKLVKFNFLFIGTGDRQRDFLRTIHEPNFVALSHSKLLACIRSGLFPLPKNTFRIAINKVSYSTVSV